MGEGLNSAGGGSKWKNAPRILLLALLLLCASATLASAYGSSFAGKVAGVSISSNPNPSTFGQNVLYIATITGGVPNGERVNFLDGNFVVGSKTLSSGSASLSLSLGIGNHTITAYYPGDSTFSAATSAPIVQFVRALPTSITMTSRPNPSAYGQQVSLIATVPGNVPNGETITLYDSGSFTPLATGNLTKGVATILISSLGTGTHSITARYSGDANLGPSTSNPVTQVVKIGASSVTLTSSLNYSASGQPVSFTATISPAGGTNKGEIITFKDGANVIGTGALLSGSATFTTSLLSVGTHFITAAYSGDANLTASGSGPLVQTVSKSSAFPGNPSACALNINLTSSTPYYVAPQPIAIYYTVNKTGACNIPTAIGTLSLSSAATGIVYASIPVNVSNIISTPVTRIIYVNSTQATTGENEAVLLLTGGGVSNLGSTTFSVLQPANITIQKINVVPNATRVGSPISIVSSVLNGAFFDADNASLNLRIIYPNLSVYKSAVHIGRVPAFRNMTITINPGIAAVPQFQGKYTIIENISFYSNYSTSTTVYSSNSLFSANVSATYSAFAAVTGYPSQNTGYNPLVGYPTPPSNIGGLTISSFPFYTDVFTGVNTSENLNSVGLYNSGNFPLTVNLTLPTLKVGKLAASAGSLVLQPRQANALKLQFTASGNDVGTYVIPINISVSSQNASSNSQLNLLLNLNNRTATPQVLSSVKLLNGSSNASVQLQLINPTNQTRYRMLLYTQLNASTTKRANSIALSGANSNLTLSASTYTLSWPISQLTPNGIAQLGYTISNITSPQGLLIPRLFLSSTKQSNSSTFNILQIHKPQNIYANTSINITISAIYTGFTSTILTLGLTPPVGANVINGQVNVKALPNSVIDAKFTVTTGSTTGNQTFKLTIPGAFGPQTQSLVLNVQPKPLAIFQLSSYLNDPRTIFGAATAAIYLIVLLYGRIRTYRAKRALMARSTVKRLDELRALGKKINVALLEEDGTKRTFMRHVNPDGSLGGFVEESAVVGKNVIVEATGIVENDAIVSGSAKILDNATISNNAVVRSKAIISGKARVSDDAEVYGNARLFEGAIAFGESEVYESARVHGEAEVFGNAHVSGEADISGKTDIFGSAQVSGRAKITKGKISKGTIVSDIG